MMTSLWIAFITGLTTGGLSCLAVQGGLLASRWPNGSRPTWRRLPPLGRAGRPDRRCFLRGPVAAAREEWQGARALCLRRRPSRSADRAVSDIEARGLYRSGFSVGCRRLYPAAQCHHRAILQLAIGTFMIGNALRMLNVHPIFRYFAFEPPSWLTRRIRRTAKRDVSTVTPLLLGALTVLIPCGVTQAMMATAMASGNPMTGAALMASFTLGTSPVFFAVAYSATRLGARLERAFVRVVAVVVLVMGLVAIETGLNMMGSPLSASRLVRALRGGVVASAEAEATPAASIPGSSGARRGCCSRIGPGGAVRRLFPVDPARCGQCCIDADGYHRPYTLVRSRLHYTGAAS